MQRDRKLGVGRAAWALLTGLAICGCSPDRPPSVILISVDTLRADHLGSYGYSRPTSPNLDAFARDALVFENAIAHGSETLSTCSSLLTGFLPHETKVNEFHALPLELETLPEILQQNGYMTVAVVSNYVLRSKQGFSQGFSIYDETMVQREQVRPMPERVAEPTTDRAIELLREYQDQPLFMWIHYQDPHATYAPPKRFAEPFLDPDQEPRLLPVNRLMTGRGGIPRHQLLGDNRDYHYYVSQYDGEIRYVDEQFGRLVDALEQLDFYENALIIFTADHGENMGEHDYFFTHGENLYHGVTRVPLIVKHGKRLKGRRAEFVQHLDVVPTVMKFLGLSSDLPFRGRDLLRPTEGREIFSETTVWWSAEEWMYSVILDGIKLIQRPNLNRFHLFDLSSDPGETKDLFNDPAYREQAEDLQRVLARLRDEDLLDLGPISPPDELTEDEKEKLRSLGYVR